jgi:hypothetical protein
MQNVSIQKASELPHSVKSALEQLLGRPIAADEERSVSLPFRHNIFPHPTAERRWPKSWKPF